MTTVCDERKCRLDSAPVWAVYPDVTAEHADRSGTATVTLPLRRCPDGHLSGWRTGGDFLGDLVTDLREVDDAALGPEGPPPRRRMLRGTFCGNCSSKLQLRDTARRLTGEVRAFVGSTSAPVTFDVDLPDVACAACGSSPARHGPGLEDLPTDLLGWMLAWVAAAMPAERAAEVRPRDEDLVE